MFSITDLKLCCILISTMQMSWFATTNKSRLFSIVIHQQCIAMSFLPGFKKKDAKLYLFWHSALQLHIYIKYYLLQNHSCIWCSERKLRGDLIMSDPSGGHLCHLCLIGTCFLCWTFLSTLFTRFCIYVITCSFFLLLLYILHIIFLSIIGNLTYVQYCNSCR